LSHRSRSKHTADVMLSDDQIAIMLIIEGYVLKNGDLYEMTPKGEKS